MDVSETFEGSLPGSHQIVIISLMPPSALDAAFLTDVEYTFVAESGYSANPFLAPLSQSPRRLSSAASYVLRFKLIIRSSCPRHSHPPELCLSLGHGQTYRCPERQLLPVSPPVARQIDWPDLPVDSVLLNRHFIA
jgi:hypothetical protein